MVIDGGWSNGKIRIRVIGRLCFRVFPLALVLVMATAAGGCHETLGQLPENPGYLRASSPRLGSLTIFGSDTFEVYRLNRGGFPFGLGLFCYSRLGLALPLGLGLAVSGLLDR